jgi:hypothetical protein
MAQWQMKIDLSDFWNKYPEEMNLKETAEKLVERLELVRAEVENKFPDYLDELDDIISDFELFEEDPDADDNLDEFNYRLDSLYDWADTKLDNEFNGKKLCWINTR